MLAELSRKFSTIEEVDFNLMLSIVNSCQDLESRRLAQQQEPHHLEQQQQQQQQQSSEGSVG
jgi:hypothetical protein